MKTLSMTPEIGFAIKNLRIQYNKTAKEISELKSINKTRSYLSKLEKGDVKKIDIELFKSILNAITESNNGLTIYLDSIADKYNSFDLITKKNYMNLDDIINEIEINHILLEHINKIITENSLTPEIICDKINKNEDLDNIPRETYKKIPENEWFFLEDNIDSGVIKLKYSVNTISDILTGNKLSTNYITLEAILYTIYKLIGEKHGEARFHATSTLDDFGMKNSRLKQSKVKRINLDSTFDGLDPQIIDIYKSILTKFKIMLVINTPYASKKLKVLEENLTSDLGFTFAFITSELSDILDLSKETKSNFLVDLKELIKRYSRPEQQSLDLYLDE